MQPFLYVFAQMILYTVGAMIACGLAIEICYQLWFLLMGRRAGRIYWALTSCVGTPVHELGHAIMCVLFGHRIEAIRLFPTKAGGALVEHSYNKGNWYAAFGNLWISLGPMISGLAVIIGVLYWVYPVSMESFGSSVGELWQTGNAADAWQCIRGLLLGLLTEQSSALWLRIVAFFLLFSMALHVRLSATDVRAMLSGVPMLLVLTTLAALVVALTGHDAVVATSAFLQRGAWTLVVIFGLILLFALLQLVLVLIYRLLYALLSLLLPKTSRPASEHGEMCRDYRDRDWEEFKH